MDRLDAQGRRIGSTRHGVYAFFDYEQEPIYVGQTKESLRQRIGRHLTNQRTDAVAMNVLDPFEVAFIEVWPLPELAAADKETASRKLNSAEYTVFQAVLQASALGAVLNEKDIAPTDIIGLPQSYRGQIVPEPIYERRKHPDIRIARRASTIARLAQVISERDVSLGLRRTLITQARRLEKLAADRFAQFEASGARVEVEVGGEETGESAE
ncbi:MAG TPA: GIY-YIG nuclease family protein [Chthonomonadaceae bacterium]|nr:GIY-YIG nuclease family protein [Chthonomonadaceae bacterium]